MEAAELELFDRGIRRATETNSGAALDAALSDLGWHDALADDRRTAVSLLFEAQGMANATSSALDYLLATALLGDEGVRAAMVLPPLRRWEAPGEVDGDRFTVRGLGTGSMAQADVAVVVATADGKATALTCKPSLFDACPTPGVDPALALVELTANVAVEDMKRRRAVDWSVAVTVGQLALGHELVGASRAMLEMARQHALDRVQFGRPISSFQAVRHRLADALVAIEAAASLLAAAWDEPSPVTAAMAKSLAGRSARTVARHAQQVLAGIGFTTEHPLHRYVRRTIVLDQLLGASSVLTRQLGADVLGSGRLPPAFPL